MVGRLDKVKASLMPELQNKNKIDQGEKQVGATTRLKSSIKNLEKE